MDTDPQSPRPQLADDVVDEVNAAYYSGLIGEPDRARTRALNGFTVASASAAALVAAGLAKGIAGRPDTLKAFGFAAVVFWLAAAGAYLCAVAGWTPRRKQRPPAQDSQEAAWRRIDDAREEKKRVRTWSNAAHSLSVVGLVTTLLLVGLVVFCETEERKAATIVLTSAGAEELARVCDQGAARTGNPTPLSVQLHPLELDSKFVELRFSGGDCRNDDADVRVRTDAIQLARLPPE